MCAKNTPIAMVQAIAVNTRSAVDHPKSLTCTKVIRAPKSATPHLSNVRAQKSTPFFICPCVIKKWKDNPINKA